jgi:hypothetical protein
MIRESIISKDGSPYFNEYPRSIIYIIEYKISFIELQSNWNKTIHSMFSFSFFFTICQNFSDHRIGSNFNFYNGDNRVTCPISEIDFKGHSVNIKKWLLYIKLKDIFLIREIS